MKEATMNVIDNIMRWTKRGIVWYIKSEQPHGRGKTIAIVWAVVFLTGIAIVSGVAMTSTAQAFLALVLIAVALFGGLAIEGLICRIHLPDEV